MTVDELTSIFTETSDQEIIIFDLDSGEELYKGTADDVPYQYLYCEVQSIDTLFTETKTITINIDLSE